VPLAGPAGYPGASSGTGIMVSKYLRCVTQAVGMPLDVFDMFWMFKLSGCLGLI